MTARRDHDNLVIRAIVLRSVAALSFSLMMALLKLATTRGVLPTELLLYRSLFGLPPVVVWALATRGVHVLRPRSISAHAGRAALGLGAMYGGYVALSLMPLAEVTTLGFTAPIFALLLSWLVLGERLVRHRLIAVLVGFLSVLIITRPGATSAAIPLLGVSIGLAAALATAIVNIALRHLLTTEHVAAIVFWFLVSGTLVGLGLLPIFGSHADGTSILIMAAAGLVGGAAQICMTASLQSAPVSVLSPFDYLQLVGALTLGWLLFGTSPTLNTIAGALLIAGSGLNMAWREHRLHRRSILAPAEVAQI